MDVSKRVAKWGCNLPSCGHHFVKYPIDFSSYKLTQNRNKRAFVGATLQTITFLLLDYNSQTYIDSSSFCYLFSWK